MMIDMREHIRESNLIEDISDPAEVDRSLEAWEHLAKHDRLTHDLVCEVHQHIVWAQTDLSQNQKGFYRSVSKVNVRVGPHVAPPWEQVDDLMSAWLEGIDERSPWANHCEFETVHPFADGNGRTGRMIFFWDEIRRGGQPTLIKASERFAYYQALQESRPIDYEAAATHIMALLDAADGTRPMPQGWSIGARAGRKERRRG